MHDAYTLLLKLDGVSQKAETQWYALCPCHDDNKQSLGVSVGSGGRLILNCLAGCDTVNILRTIGASYSDLFPKLDIDRHAYRHTDRHTDRQAERQADRQASHVAHSSATSSAASPSTTSPSSASPSTVAAKPKPKIVKTYDYHTADGRLLFQVVRFEPKDFRQRRPDPANPKAWLWKMDDVQRVLYRLPQIVAAPATEIIYLVEGEKDVDRLVKCGLNATTVPGGAGKWNGSYSESLRGRNVVLIPDMDRANEQTGMQPGWAHVVKVANALIGIAASVRILELPNTFEPPLVPKWDVSDWLDRGGTKPQFMSALAACPPWKRQPVPGDADHPDTQPVEADDDPHRLATLFLAQFKHPDGVTLRFWRDSFHRWDGRAYRSLPTPEIRAEIATCCKAEFDRINATKLKTWIPSDSNPLAPQAQKVTQTLIGNIMLALQGMTLLSGTIEQPAWISLPAGSQLARRDCRDFIALENGILDVGKLLTDGESALLPHSPRWFSPVAMEFCFEPEADCPHWKAFVERNLEADPERAEMLQEWFGYCLTIDTSFQRFLFLEGEGSNGKSVICAALTALLGQDNVSHVSLEMFAKDFVLTQTLGKLANIAAEVGEIDKMAEGYLKSFTAGDRMTFNRKNQSLIEAAPTARLVLSANNRPRFSDRSEGIWRRMLILPLTVTIQPHERVYGMDKPEWWFRQGELPGMLNWALAGLYRLREQRSFTIPAISSAALTDYKEEANPARRFLVENYEEDPNGSVVTQDIYRHYRGWCEDHGNKPLASNQFAKEINRVFKNAVRGKARDFNGERRQGFFGIEKRNENISDGEQNQTQNNPDNSDRLFDPFK